MHTNNILAVWSINKSILFQCFMPASTNLIVAIYFVELKSVLIIIDLHASADFYSNERAKAKEILKFLLLERAVSLH